MIRKIQNYYFYLFFFLFTAFFFLDSNNTLPLFLTDYCSNEEVENKITYCLKSDTYENAELKFALQSSIFPPQPDYTVMVQLFKNQYFTQSDIIRVKVGNSQKNNDIGYIFRLDALFQNNVLDLNKHTFPYAFQALEYIFQKDVDIQTKSKVSLKDDFSQFKIQDFFDEDTLIFVLCNEYCNAIDSFSINNYLPDLYLHGFNTFSSKASTEVFNNSQFVRDKYQDVKDQIRGKDNVIGLTLFTSIVIKEDGFLVHIFENLVQRQNDSVTKFIILYQAVEILIARILRVEIQKQVCTNFESLDSQKLKNLLFDIQKESNRITLLFNSDYVLPPLNLSQDLERELILFFKTVGDNDYLDEKDNNKSFPSIFYIYRNKLVHNYRIIHNDQTKLEDISDIMNKINELTEVLIAHTIVNFKK